jgi:hypothetical protein
VQNEIETTEGEDMDLSEALEGNSSEKTSEFLPPKKKRLNCSHVAQTKL